MFVCKLRRRSIENDPAIGHADHPLTKPFRQFHVMNVDDHGNVALASEVGHQFHDFHRGLRIERGGRLVGQQDLRMLHHGAGDPHPLPLPARQRIGALIGEAGKAYRIKQVECFLNILRGKFAHPCLEG